MAPERGTAGMRQAINLSPDHFPFGPIEIAVPAEESLLVFSNTELALLVDSKLAQDVEGHLHFFSLTLRT